VTRTNCDRCGREVNRDTKDPCIGILKWHSSFYLHPMIEAWDLCKACLEWVKNEATVYERSVK
jgi:hypothetical protein